MFFVRRGLPGPRLKGEKMPKRIFTAEEIVECAQEALDNWDFEIELENGRSERFIQAQRDALGFDLEYARDTWCYHAPMSLGAAYSDIWDFLYEFSVNMASQVEVAP
jgi:hypothetical protein